MNSNLHRMAEHCKSYGCALRPHVKTHKSPELALHQLEMGASGITVAKISEAEVMADGGISDIFMAYPIIGKDKVDRAAKLSKRIRLILSVDSYEGAVMLSDAARENGVEFEVRLELDTGMGRSGCYPEDCITLAKQAASLAGIRLTGISTYRNLIYNGKPNPDAVLCGRDEGASMAALAEAMRREGLNIVDVSVGSTATAEACATVSGVTEVRPGTYIFYDKMQQAKGACDESMLAAWVDVTVISVKGSLVVVDGGNKSISADCPPDGIHYPGFGEVLGHPELTLYAMTEEHGMLRSDHTPVSVKVGDRLSIIPNHICTTVNLYNSAYLKSAQGLRKIPISARGSNT